MTAPHATAPPFGVYVHVPFCTVRCGYCDFNTYTAPVLGDAPGASRATYADAAVAEIRRAREFLAADAPRVETVFFGGGTPTLLPPADLIRILRAIDAEFGLAPDAEVTTEANPDSVDAGSLAELRDGGINRISFGMQSAVPSVLAVLDRTHDPDRLPGVVADARRAGFDQLSLDLIYGAPGETVDQWRTSVETALALAPDHVSAYALIVEPGTALARRIAHGELSAPDEDEMADKYELADDLLATAGFSWYELSNWARDQASRCRHNLGYWTGANWWGVGPGAHSHVDGTRWWNAKHPAAYADRLARGESPAVGQEVLDAETRRVERVLLESRLDTGLDPAVLDDPGRAAAEELVADGLLLPGRSALTLTRRGRLLADLVVRRLVP